MASINTAAESFPHSARATSTSTPLERSRRLNTALLVVIALLLMFGALGGTYLYTVVTGLSSTIGAEGAPGPIGIPGADGSDGSDGADGAMGQPGAMGSDGRNGADGKDGLDGLNGAAGIDGVDGAPGADGADGVTLYNSGQGIVDLGACDSDVSMAVRSRLVGDVFYLTSITLSDISSDCAGALVDVYALGGSSPNWVTLTDARGVEIAGDSLVIDTELLGDDSVLSSDVRRIALEVR